MCFSLRREKREDSWLYGKLTLFIPNVLPEFFGVPFQCIILNPNGDDVGWVCLSPGNLLMIRIQWFSKKVHHYFCVSVLKQYHASSVNSTTSGVVLLL